MTKNKSKENKEGHDGQEEKEFSHGCTSRDDEQNSCPFTIRELEEIERMFDVQAGQAINLCNETIKLLAPLIKTGEERDKKLDKQVEDIVVKLSASFTGFLRISQKAREWRMKQDE